MAICLVQYCPGISYIQCVPEGQLSIIAGQAKMEVWRPEVTPTVLSCMSHAVHLPLTYKHLWNMDTRGDSYRFILHVTCCPFSLSYNSLWNMETRGDSYRSFLYVTCCPFPLSYNSLWNMETRGDSYRSFLYVTCCPFPLSYIMQVLGH